MEPYIQDWLDILGQMVNTNTYKLAFGLGILECASSERYEEDIFGTVDISLQDIADCMIRYYWNQCFFFKLKQQPGNKVPYIYQYVDELIKHYIELSGSNLPVWSDKGLAYLARFDYEFFDKRRMKAASVLPVDVAWRLKNVNGTVKEIYKFDKTRDKSLHFRKEHIKLLQDYSSVLSRLFSYKWSQLLEKWNESPRLLSKVIGASDSEIRRHSLTEFKKPLLLQFGSGPILDFYTHRPLKTDEISIDHVIPWSYLYSDDIWNLVVTSKSVNSQKSNATPEKKWIDALKARNDILLPLVKNAKMEKFEEDLLEAQTSQLVDRYYFGLTRTYL